MTHDATVVVAALGHIGVEISKEEAEVMLEQADAVLELHAKGGRRAVAAFLHGHVGPAALRVIMGVMTPAQWRIAEGRLDRMYE